MKYIAEANVILANALASSKWLRNATRGYIFDKVVTCFKRCRIVTDLKCCKGSSVVQIVVLADPTCRAVYFNPVKADLFIQPSK